MSLAGIYVDTDGKSHVFNDPPNATDAPKEFTTELAKYDLCAIDYDQGHRDAKISHKKLQELIDAAIAAERAARAAIKATAEAALAAAHTAAETAKAAAKAAETAADTAADTAFAKTQADINAGNTPFAGLNSAQKGTAHQKAKDDKTTAKGNAHTTKTNADNAADAAETAAKKVANAAMTAAYNALPAPALGCSPAGKCAGKTCKLARIYKTGMTAPQPEVKAKTGDIKYFEDQVLYFCTCSTIG